MRTTFLKQTGLLIFIAMATIFIAGCGGGKSTAATTPAPTVSTAASISLSSTGTKVKSDGSDSVTITATVLDANNASLPNQAISISTNTGQLSSSSATTNASGVATFTFSGGTFGLNNTATVMVSATGSAATKSMPIQITGSTLSLTSSTNSAVAGSPLPITITAKNSGGVAVPSQSLRYSIASTSTGSGTLSAATGTTDFFGVSNVSLTGSAVGNVDVLVEWLDATNAVTSSTTKTFAVTSSASAFMVTTPATSPFAATIGANQSVVINTPATIGATTVASIRYATTLGTWLANSSKVLTVARTAASDTQTFVPGASAGNASIQVDALNSSGAVITSASFIFSISSPSTNAASITLQSNVSVLPPSLGTNSSTATFTALVRDNALNPVGGANVLFELVGSTGTGESISPVVVTTNSTTSMGQAQATFTAGASPTTQGAGVKATIVGTAISATASITVGGTATSVSLGASTTMSAVNQDTAYKLPVSVIVSDSSGGRISGAVVSLSLWPVRYYKGTHGSSCAVLYVGGSHPNEDKNESLTLDPGEDIDGPGGVLAGLPTTAPVGPPDGFLWPAPSTAGTIPQTVTTGIDGTATFDWVYLKQYADWVDARIRATIQVQGTQSTTSIILPLAPLATDLKTPCPLPSSPFN